MIRLDALSRRRAASGSTASSESPQRDQSGAPTGHIELRPSDHEEPTWEVRHPGDRPRRRLDGRTRTILAVAAAATVVVNAGAAWLYWRITGSETGHWGAAATVELTLRARSDIHRPLLAGQTGNLTVTVTNDDDTPVKITSVGPGTGRIVPDAEHRERGCQDPGVRLTRDRFAVSWEVPRNTIGAFTLPGALSMPAESPTVCHGAVFTVPIQAYGRT
ncbi:hypothetical protein ACFQS1_16555 [Paractinoplanes rhizophilus]|uniref:Uncharacterized protein n=1 Tax=Paractinoplanes rhizophilus TaxID=1416877 RepID=A0ABW2HS03_9ACTN